MFKKALLQTTLVISLALFFIPVSFNVPNLKVESSIVFAQCPPNCSGTGGGSGGSATLQNPLVMNDLVSVINAIVDILVILAVPIIIIFIVYAGFLYVTAQGNPSKISDAHKALLYALIGGAIILGAKVLGSIVAVTVNSITVP